MTNINRRPVASTAVFLAHTSHFTRGRKDDVCPICKKQGPTRCTWLQFCDNY